MRLVLAAVGACVLLGLAAPSGNASSGVRFGIQDDAWLTHGPGTLDDRLDRIRTESAIVLEARGPAESIRGVLETTPGVERVVQAGVDGEHAAFEVHAIDGEDPRELLARRGVAEGSFA